MPIRPDSLLRKLPANLDRRQLLFLDGIRIALEMCELSYTRLVRHLDDLTSDPPTSPGGGARLLEAMQEAWSIVDSVHRLRILLQRLPRLKQRRPWLQAFYRGTASVGDLRNVVQHFDTEIEDLAKQNAPVWGRLTWFTMSDAAASEGHSCIIVLGSFFQRADVLINPLGRVMHEPLDLVTLSAGTHEACLSDVVRHSLALIEPLERGLAVDEKGDSTGLPSGGSDIMLKATLAFLPPDAGGNGSDAG
jgi:hypothetical protein